MADKICSCCGDCKLFSDFYPDQSKTDGRSSRCIECSTVRKKKNVKDNRNAISKLAFETGEKTCTICKKIKPISEFRIKYPTNTFHNPVISSYCTECNNARLREYGTGVPKEIRSKAMVDQNGICKLCNGEFQKPDEVVLQTDHCHVTGIFRGMLCIICNTTVRSHTPAYLRWAAEYVEKQGNIHQEKENEVFEIGYLSDGDCSSYQPLNCIGSH